MVGVTGSTTMPTTSEELLNSLDVPEGWRGWADMVLGGGGERAIKLGEKGRTHVCPAEGEGRDECEGGRSVVQ